MSEFKRKMYDKIHEFSNDKYLDGYIRDEFITDDGDADIFLTINNIDELIDKRTSGNQLDLNKDVYAFIDEKSEMLENDTELELHINGIELDNKTKESVKHIIKEHYAIELYKIQRKYIKCRNKIIGLFIIGLISLLTYIFVFINKDTNFLIEIFGFIFTFSLWEAIDAYIYSFNDIKYDRENVTQNLLMKVCFDEDKKSSTE